MHPALSGGSGSLLYQTQDGHTRMLSGGQGTGSVLPMLYTVYRGRTKYSALVSKLYKLSEEYLSPQKTQKAAGFFYSKDLGAGE